LVAEVDAGETIAEVARRHRVRPKTLSWWRWKLRSGTSASSPRLLPVVVRSALVAESSSIELRIRDVIVRVASGSDVTYIAVLVDVRISPIVIAAIAAS
jgi:transposase-like protein